MITKLGKEEESRLKRGVNWVKKHPVKAGLVGIPLGLAAGYGIHSVLQKGMKSDTGKIKERFERKLLPAPQLSREELLKKIKSQLKQFRDPSRDVDKSYFTKRKILHDYKFEVAPNTIKYRNGARLPKKQVSSLDKLRALSNSLDRNS